MHFDDRERDVPVLSGSQEIIASQLAQWGSDGLPCGTLLLLGQARSRPGSGHTTRGDLVGTLRLREVTDELTLGSRRALLAEALPAFAAAAAPPELLLALRVRPGDAGARSVDWLWLADLRALCPVPVHDLLVLTPGGWGSLELGLRGDRPGVGQLDQASALLAEAARRQRPR